MIIDHCSSCAFTFIHSRHGCRSPISSQCIHTYSIRMSRVDSRPHQSSPLVNLVKFWRGGSCCVSFQHLRMLSVRWFSCIIPQPIYTCKFLHPSSLPAACTFYHNRTNTYRTGNWSTPAHNSFSRDSFALPYFHHPQFLKGGKFCLNARHAVAATSTLHSVFVTTVIPPPNNVQATFEPG